MRYCLVNIPSLRLPSEPTPQKICETKSYSLDREGSVQGTLWQSVLFFWWIEICKLDFFKGGFDILRLDIFSHYIYFSWNAYCVPSIGPDVSHPQFIFIFLPVLVKFFIALKFSFGRFDSNITEKDSLLDNSNIKIGVEAFLRVFATSLQIYQQFTFHSRSKCTKTGCSNKKYLISKTTFKKTNFLSVRVN